jgi:hydroxymethylbilane synthase
MKKQVLVGTRGSALALIQTEEVLERLRAAHGDTVDFQVVTVRTGGDAAPETPLARLGRGIWVKEIERQLLDGELDMAVHSLKDMTTVLPGGLTIGAVCKRLDPRDVLVNRWGRPLADLPTGARIGTSSPRRLAQLKSLRSDLEVLPIRGNVDTRLRKARGDEYDGAVLAFAGLARMGFDGEASEMLSTEDFVPAPGQGALAVESRQDDQEMTALLAPVDHPATRRAVTAERAFLEALGGGCQVPVGVYARLDGDTGDTMVMTVFLASQDGSKVMKTRVTGRADSPREVALDAYRRLMEGGAGSLIEG